MHDCFSSWHGQQPGAPAGVSSLTWLCMLAEGLQIMPAKCESAPVAFLHPLLPPGLCNSDGACLCCG